MLMDSLNEVTEIHNFSIIKFDGIKKKNKVKLRAMKKPSNIPPPPSFLSKFKNSFKKTEENPPPKEMILTDNKFKYNSVTKRYEFEGEDNTAVEEFAPPPKGFTIASTRDQPTIMRAARTPQENFFPTYQHPEPNKNDTENFSLEKNDDLLQMSLLNPQEENISLSNNKHGFIEKLEYEEKKQIKENKQIKEIKQIKGIEQTKEIKQIKQIKDITQEKEIKEENELENKLKECELELFKEKKKVLELATVINL